MKRTFRTVAVAITAVMTVMLAACGSSGRNNSATGGGATATTTATQSGMFGDLPSPCGPGNATGATDLGVTNTSINIGYGDDAGYPAAPGLNHQMSDAVKAFVQWCNDLGGILGRKVDATYYDAKITEVNNVVTEACKKEFFIVGEGWSLDAAQEQARRGCGLPAVAGYAVSPQFANAPLKWEPFPIPADYTNTAPAAQLAKLYPDKIQHMAVMFGNYSATIDSKDKVVSTWPNFGYKVLDCPQEYNIGGEADWKPFVQKLKDCGAQIVYFVGSPYPNFENVLTAAAQIDYKPIWYVDPNFYDLAFSAWNTSGYGDNVYLRESYTPLFEASADPATQQYIDIMNKYGGDQNQLGEQSASAFLLWATAAKACGSTLTRDCMTQKLNATTSWTGGGLHAEANPGQNLPSDCGMLMKLQGTDFQRVTPPKAGTYDCEPSYAAKVTGPELERAKLDSNRVSQL